MPAYGSKDDVTRTIKPDAHTYIEQQSQTSDNAHRRPALRFQATQPRAERPPRRQGYMKQQAAAAIGTGSAANVQGALHVAGYGEQRRRKRRKAKLLAKRAELNAVADILQMAKVRDALAQADAALESVNNANRFVKGYHSDGSIFRVWEKAMELIKQEDAQPPVTMKGLR
jgi:hypothetical protein